MIKVLKPGIYSSIQDRGRFGFRHLGIPLAGTMDSFSANIANSLLNNKLTNSVMEITMQGPTLEFFVSTKIAISGANISPKINNVSILNNKVYTINKGDVLSFGILITGFRCYLAVLGGFLEENILNSKSYYAGITSRMKLNKNDRIAISIQNFKSFDSKGILTNQTPFFETDILEVFPGPEYDMFSKQQQNKLLSTKFNVSSKNNRMGYRLRETVLKHSISMITSPVIPGTIQLTPEGKLIILMKDSQTTGGYPRVLQLSEKSIAILAQKTTNDSVKFKLNSYK